MSRIANNENDDHRITITDDGARGELILVRGGKKRAYLWAGRKDGEAGCVTFSGEKILRKFAEEILKELA